MPHGTSADAQRDVWPNHAWLAATHECTAIMLTGTHRTVSCTPLTDCRPHAELAWADTRDRFVCVQIENPFVVLPLEAFCRAIKANVQTQVLGVPGIPNRTLRHAGQWRCCLLQFGVPPGLCGRVSSCLGRSGCGCTPGPHLALKRLIGPRLAFPPCSVQEPGVSCGNGCFPAMTGHAHAHLHVVTCTLAHCDATPARGLGRVSQVLTIHAGAGAGDASCRRAGGMRSILGAPNCVSGHAGARRSPAGRAQAGAARGGSDLQARAMYARAKACLPSAAPLHSEKFRTRSQLCSNSARSSHRSHGVWLWRPLQCARRSIVWTLHPQ